MSDRGHCCATLLLGCVLALLAGSCDRETADRQPAPKGPADQVTLSPDAARAGGIEVAPVAATGATRVVTLTGTLSATPWTPEEQTALSDAGNADAKLDLAKANYARISNLASEGIVARQDLDAARSELDQARSAAAQADAKRENLGLTGSEKDIAPLSRIWGLAALPESDLREVAVGQAVDVETSAFPGQKFSGKVVAISRSADAETRQFTVRIAIVDPAGKLHSQMLATFGITAPAGPGLSIPSSAVLLEADGAYVYVANGRTFHRRAVKIGASAGGRTQVVQGLAAGESLVVKGAQLLESERLKSQIKTEEDSD